MNPSPVAYANFTKATDLSPATVAGLALWARADVGVEADEAGQVSVWRDVSGRNNDLTQATPAAPPQLVPDDGHGRQVVHFDGEDDVLLFTRQLTQRPDRLLGGARGCRHGGSGVHCLLGDAGPAPTSSVAASTADLERLRRRRCAETARRG